MSQNADISKLPIQRLLQQLAAADFEITAHEWYRTELAIAKHQSLLYSSEGLEELGLILGPLLCKNEKQQQRFQVIYQDFLKKLKADLPPEKSSIPAPPELKQAAWWLPLLLAVVPLLLLYVGLNWYQKNYKEAHKSKRFQYEVMGDLDNFQLGDTLQLQSKTSKKDSATHDFYWYIKDAQDRVRWDHKGHAYQDLVFDDPVGIEHTLHFIVYKKDSDTQFFSGPVRRFVVHCAEPPVIKDVIEIAGTPRVGEELTFSIETEGSGFTYKWDLGIDSLLTAVKPNWTFTEPGDYPIQLSLMDTTGQKGDCTTKIGTNIQIEDDQPALVALPELTLLKDESGLNFTYSNWIYGLLGLLLVLMALFWWLWDRQRRQFKAQQEEQRKAEMQAPPMQDKAPYQIPFRTHSDEIQKGSLPFQIGNILRRRQEGSRHLLDIPKTIQQTVEGGGFWDLQYRLNTRPTDYLFLIDQTSSKSHLARLFLYLAQTLRDQDVHVDYWTYRGTFDRFWNPQYQGYADLNQLQKAFGDRKLIVFGNGEELLDTFGAKDQLDTFSKWKYRILVTPRPIVSWSSKEKRLYQSFPIFPADLENLMEAAKLIEQEWEADDLPAYFADWKKQFARKLPDDPDSETRLKRWPQYRAYLEQHPELLPWVKALVVHPELRWDLTIALGKAIGAPVTFDNLLILSRIPAFEEGVFPIKVWRSIWDQLDLEQEWRARQAVKTELAAIPEETIQGSFAAQRIATDLDIHNFALDPYNKDHQKAIRRRIATGQIGPQRMEELDLVVSRQTETIIETKQRGLATETFLADEEEIKEPPKWTPYFWLASLFTLLTLLFLGARLIVNPQTLGPYFYEKKGAVPFYLEMQQPEAQRLNNLAVDNLYDNLESNNIEQLASKSFEYLREALAISEGDYLLATDNTFKFFYLLGKNAYEQLELNDNNERSAYIYFNDILSQTAEKTVDIYNIKALVREKKADSLQFHALNGLASIQYSLLRPDSACFYVGQMRENYLDQLAFWGQTMPYLGYCQDSEFRKESLYDPNIIFVDQSKNGGGSSWSDAKASLQEALSIAKPGQMIWVAYGEYYPTSVNDRNASFIIPDGIMLYGGFGGYEYTIDERDLESYKTILSGEIGGPGIEDNSYTVVLTKGVSSSTIIDGFTITRGNANRKVEEGEPGSSGAGWLNISEQKISSPIIRNCTFESNNGYFGAGFYNDARGGQANTLIEDCKFNNNIAKIDGGGILSNGSNGVSNITIRYTTFFLNEAYYGSALLSKAEETGECNANIRHVVFENNIAYIKGSPIYNRRTGEGVVNPIMVSVISNRNEESVASRFNIISNNFVNHTQTIDTRLHSSANGFIIDKAEDQLIVAAPYTRPSADDLKLYAPSHKIKIGSSNQEYDAELITDFPNEEIAFFSIGGLGNYQWVSNFYTTDLKVGQRVDIPVFGAKAQRSPAIGRILRLGEESFNLELENYSGKKGPVMANGKVAGLITQNVNREEALGIPFDYILALYENTFITDPDKLFPPQQESLSKDMVLIKGGTFEMGDVFGDGFEREKPTRSVTLSDFYIADHEVTFEEYDAYCRAKKIDLPEDVGWGRGRRPVINVSWYDAVRYCNWKSTQEKLQVVYTIKGNDVSADWSANGYRLPTEAEWEYAARSRGQKQRYAGTSAVDSLRNYAHYDTIATAVVRSYQPNAIGLYDMSGNVWEWCWDWYSGDYYANRKNTRDPRGPSGGSFRLYCGGSWFSTPGYCRVAYRDYNGPAGRGNGLGFRLASSSR